MNGRARPSGGAQWQTTYALRCALRSLRSSPIFFCGAILTASEWSGGAAPSGYPLAEHSHCPGGNDGSSAPWPATRSVAEYRNAATVGVSAAELLYFMSGRLSKSTAEMVFGTATPSTLPSSDLDHQRMVGIPFH